MQKIIKFSIEQIAMVAQGLIFRLLAALLGLMGILYLPASYAEILVPTTDNIPQKHLKMMVTEMELTKNMTIPQFLTLTRLPSISEAFAKVPEWQRRELGNRRLEDLDSFQRERYETIDYSKRTKPTYDGYWPLGAYFYRIIISANLTKVDFKKPLKGGEPITSECMPTPAQSQLGALSNHCKKTLIVAFCYKYSDSEDKWERSPDAAIQFFYPKCNKGHFVTTHLHLYSQISIDNYLGWNDKIGPAERVTMACEAPQVPVNISYDTVTGRASGTCALPVNPREVFTDEDIAFFGPDAFATAPNSPIIRGTQLIPSKSGGKASGSTSNVSKNSNGSAAQVANSTVELATPLTNMGNLQKCPKTAGKFNDNLIPVFGFKDQSKPVEVRSEDCTGGKPKGYSEMLHDFNYNNKNHRVFTSAVLSNGVPQGIVFSRIENTQGRDAPDQMIFLSNSAGKSVGQHGPLNFKKSEVFKELYQNYWFIPGDSKGISDAEVIKAVREWNTKASQSGATEIGLTEQQIEQLIKRSNPSKSLGY